jgi:hypothetical protein
MRTKFGVVSQRCLQILSRPCLPYSPNVVTHAMSTTLGLLCRGLATAVLPKRLHAPAVGWLTPARAARQVLHIYEGLAAARQALALEASAPEAEQEETEPSQQATAQPDEALREAARAATAAGEGVFAFPSSMRVHCPTMMPVHACPACKAAWE